ncbi:MAG TPA: ABC transporter ATP-binding protein [Sediminispirochaeta sp.]|nr:ABC transporter ATP-binding protein [Sediminispirochaeta sp.]
MASSNITVEGLRFSYNQKEPLFDGLGMSLEKGNVYGLLGKNGAGKTSLLRLLAGLLYVQQGRIDVFGYDPGDRSPDLLWDIFFLPEEFALPAIKIGEYRKIYGAFYPRFDEESFRRHLEEFQLNVDQKLLTLSYGQKKKFLLAFGLASGASLCILDEPTNGLDIPSKSQFRRMVAASADQERLFLISTHQVRDMEHLIDPVIIIDGGRIVFQADLFDISHRLKIEKVPQLPAEELLYQQEELGGYRIVRPNRGQEESEVDLETLFNAVISAPAAVAGILRGEERNESEG